MLLGSFVLAGWAFDIQVLKSVFPSLVTMKANTALAFILAGLSLRLKVKDEGAHRLRLLAHCCAFVVTFLGFLTLSEYLFAWNLGVDTLLFSELPGARSTLFLGRMAPATALCFLLVGIALSLLDVETRHSYKPAQFLILGPSLLSFMALIGYAYNARELYEVASYTPMALHTALAFAVLCAGVLCARPDSGLMSIVVSEHIGGALARRLLLPSIGVLVGLGWVRLAGERAGLYSTEFGGVLTVTAGGIIFVAFVWITAKVLNQIESEHQRVEETLRESEERYRSLVETAQDAVFTVSPDGTFASLNPAFETLTDWSRTEWLGQPFAPLIHPDDLPLALELFQRLLQGETPPLSELRIVFKSGASHFWEFTATPQFREGKVVGVLAIARDTTERRQVEERLRESEVRFRAIFEGAAIGIALVDMQGRFAKTNPTMSRLLGYSEGELYGARFTDFTYPEDRDTDWGLFRELVENKREYYQREKRYICKDGGLIWTRLTVSLIRGAGGEPQFAVGMVEDITARKWAEEVLRLSEEYFRALIENASDIISILNTDGTIRYQSPSGERLLGYTMEELAGKNAFEFVHPEDLEKLLNTFTQGISIPGHMTTMEFRFHHKDGSWRHLEGIGKNLLDSPAVAGIVVNFRDVTARKQAEQALRESEERFRLLSASSPVGIFSTDVSGACLYSNQRWQDIVGLSQEESLGYEWMVAITPDDRESVVAEWQACVGAGREFSREFRFLRPSGEIRWVRAQAVALYADSSALLGYVGTVEDITERKRAEMELERLRHQQELILQSVADGIQVLDLQGKATFMNPAAARMIRYDAEELIGRFTHDILHHSKPDGTPYLHEKCPILRTLTDGALRHVTDEMFWRKDGTSFPVEYISAPMREGDKTTGVVVTFRDISERRAVERLKDEFVSVVSHELRTPLTSIRGALGLLTSGLIGALPERGQRMLEIAVNNTDRLVRLINDILDIERMQSGKVTMQRQLCDAAALLQQASDEMRALADKAGVRLVVRPHPLRLWADPDRIVQTLTNLLSNAIKFSPPHTTVELSTARRGEEAVFTVQDQGRGIPTDKLESIFERFQQVDASDSRQKGGTGLGLAICRSIVEQHGGRIWVESGARVGSTFYFTLPVWREGEAPLEGPVGRPSPPTKRRGESPWTRLNAF